jgi:rRNA maturation RNase YbeY
MKPAFTFRNRQRLRRVNAPLLKEIITAALEELGVAPDSEICFHLVSAPEMARINWQFLQHEGSTDVITFDLSEQSTRTPRHIPRQLHGEIFICIADAIAQAKEFQTSWQSELVRYAVHGVLHLLGHDDLKPVARRKMKREENRLVQLLAKQFPLTRVGR